MQVSSIQNCLVFRTPPSKCSSPFRAQLDQTKSGPYALALVPENSAFLAAQSTLSRLKFRSDIPSAIQDQIKPKLQLLASWKQYQWESQRRVSLTVASHQYVYNNG